MTFLQGILFVFLVIVVVILMNLKSEKKKEHRISIYGNKNSEIICPHCKKKGYVFTLNEKKKKGISGGKATAAIMTGGVSLIATGLSRKENITSAYCGNCESEWFF